MAIAGYQSPLNTISAIICAGAGWVPFDPDAPAARVGDALQDANCTYVVVDAATAEHAKDFSIPSLLVQDILEPSIPDAPLDARLDAQPDDPAYVIFTSGSTGKPKGVLVSHRNACHWMRAENSLLGVRTEDVVLQGFSPAFDMSIEEIWTAYLVGATLVITEQNMAQLADQLPKLVATMGISVIHAVPSLLGMVPEGPEYDMPTVRLINVGGGGMSTKSGCALG
jgi:non-ribosomal peptide synthetase component F